jgi:hypothetical protein
VQHDTHRAAYSDEICNFGQTPNQLFSRRHPPRRVYNGKDLLDAYDSPSNFSPTPEDSQLRASVDSLSLNPITGADLAHRKNRNNGVHEMEYITAPSEIIFSTKSLEATLNQVPTRTSPPPPRYNRNAFFTQHHQSPHRMITPAAAEPDERNSPHVYTGPALSDVTGIVFVDSEMVCTPRDSLLLSTTGRFHLLLSFGQPDCTFNIHAAFSSPLSPRRKATRSSSPETFVYPTPRTQSQSQSMPSLQSSSSLQSESTTPTNSTSSKLTGQMLRGFESKATKGDGSIGQQPSRFSSLSDVDISSLSDIGARQSRGIGVETRPLSPRDTPDLSLSGWKKICQFDSPHITISCATLGGLTSSGKNIIITAHRDAPVIHLWAIDTNALLNAAADAFSMSTGTIPKVYQAVVLLQSYTSSAHVGRIAHIASCLYRDHLQSCTGHFATACEGHRVVLWEYFYSDDVNSSQPVSSAYSGIPVYPLENAASSPSGAELSGMNMTQDVSGGAQDALSSDEVSPREAVECVNGLSFDSVSTDLLVCVGSRVVVFDINGRVRSVADPISLVSVSLATTALALCIQAIHSPVWEPYRSFLVGYSDGTILLWTMYHIELRSEQELCTQFGATDSQATAATSPLKGGGESKEEHVRRIMRSVHHRGLPGGVTAEKSCATRLLRYSSSNSPLSTPVYENIKTEHACTVVLSIHPSIRSNLPVTRVRLSPDWEHIIAGRVDGTVVRWRIKDE